MNNTIINNLELLSLQYVKKNENKWKTKSLQNAIKTLYKYENIIVSGKQLKEEIKGIGDGIAKRIDEIINTGTLSELELELDLENDNNKDLKNKENNDEYNQKYILLKNITGVGDKRASEWSKLEFKNIEDLKCLILNNKIKSTHHIDIGIKYYDDLLKKIPRNEIDDLYKIISKIISEISETLIFEICGSYRRGLDYSGDVDILLTDKYSNNKKIKSNNYLTILVNNLKKRNIIIDDLTTTSGGKKYMGIYKFNNNYGRRIDIRYIDYEEFYTALLYFTGSKNFNLDLRKKAIKMGYKLSEYSLIKVNNNEKMNINSEYDIFNILDVDYIDPTKRDI